MLVADMAESGGDAVQKGLRADESVIREHVGAVGEMLPRAEADFEMKRPVFPEETGRRDLAIRRDLDLGQQFLDQLLLGSAKLVAARPAIEAIEGQRIAGFERSHVAHAPSDLINFWEPLWRFPRPRDGVGFFARIWVPRRGERPMAKPVVSKRAPRLLHPFFISLGGTLLMAALFTDYMYSCNSLIQWSNFSAWLIAGGLVFALVAVIFLLIDFALGRAGPISWLDFILVGAAAIISLFNVLVHTRDAWTSVMPTGITLSVIVTILLLVAGIRGWAVTMERVVERGESR